jgi:hypothetical protein
MSLPQATTATEMLSSSGCVASAGRRHTKSGLAIVRTVAQLFREHKSTRKVMEIAYEGVSGFKELYAIKGTAHRRAVSRFGLVFKKDLAFWMTQGETFGDIEFEDRSSAMKRVRSEAKGVELLANDEELTDESSEFDELEYESRLAEKAKLEFEFNELTKRHTAKITELNNEIVVVRQTFARITGLLSKKRVEVDQRIEHMREKKKRVEVHNRLEEIERMREQLEEEEKKLKAVLKGGN